MGLKPLPRFYKPGWFDQHKSFVDTAKSSSSNVLLIGDSIVSGLLRYSRVWSKYFEPYDALNFGSPGDCVENVMWRVQHGELPAQLEITVIHARTNNVDKHPVHDIASGIIQIASYILSKKPGSNVIITGLLPRDEKATSIRRTKINAINHLLQHECQSQRNVTFLEPSEDWLQSNGDLRKQLYYRDFLHLVERGNSKFASWIQSAIERSMQGSRNAISNTIATSTKTTNSDLYDKTCTVDLSETSTDKTVITHLTETAHDITVRTDFTETASGKTVTTDLTETAHDKIVPSDLTETLSDRTVTTDLTEIAHFKTVTTDLTETVHDIDRTDLTYTCTAPDETFTTDLTETAPDKTVISDFTENTSHKTFTADLTETASDKSVSTDLTETASDLMVVTTDPIETAPDLSVTTDLTETAPDKTVTTDLTETASNKTSTLDLTETTFDITITVISDLSYTPPQRTVATGLTETASDITVTTDLTETAPDKTVITYLTDNTSYRTAADLHDCAVNQTNLCDLTEATSDKPFNVQVDLTRNTFDRHVTKDISETTDKVVTADQTGTAFDTVVTAKLTETGKTVTADFTETLFDRTGCNLKHIDKSVTADLIDTASDRITSDSTETDPAYFGMASNTKFITCIDTDKTVTSIQDIWKCAQSGNLI